MRVTLLALPCALLAVSGCAVQDDGPVAAGGAVTVSAGDDRCELDRTELTAGRNVFAITNIGSQVTEVYLYADGDRIVTEKENIGPGVSYELTTQIEPGSYVVACKPGMVGEGIRTPITVAGQGR